MNLWLKGLLFYFLTVFAIIALSLIHGVVVFILNSLGVTTIGFADTLYNADKLFLVFLMFPIAVVIILILIIKIFFPAVATLIVDILNNLFAILNWNFSTLTLGSSVDLVNFYFGLVNAFALILLNISVFKIT